MNHLFETLASLLEYPSSDLNLRVERARQWLTNQEPEVAAGFISFRRKIRAFPVDKLQELYTQTFDLNPACTLDIGYHVFGENYKRGELLAKLRETEAPYELGQANQLPDYLPVLLRLLTKLEDEELRLALIGEILIPALGKMRDALAQPGNPYRDLIEVISNALEIELPECNSLGSGEDIPELYNISSRATVR